MHLVQVLVQLHYPVCKNIDLFYKLLMFHKFHQLYLRCHHHQRLLQLKNYLLKL